MGTVPLRDMLALPLRRSGSRRAACASCDEPAPGLRWLGGAARPRLCRESLEPCRCPCPCEVLCASGPTGRRPCLVAMGPETALNGICCPWKDVRRVMAPR